MTAVKSVVLEVPDPAEAENFYATAFSLGSLIRFRTAKEPTAGFRGFMLSLVVSQPSTVDALLESALAGGAAILKPAKKSFWGYGCVIQAPDGTIWKLATSAKKNSGPKTRHVDEVVLLLGVTNVKATKLFYVERGMTVGKSFGSKYVEFSSPGSPVKLALYSRRAAAKDAGVSDDGTGSHRIIICGEAVSFTDPDGFKWESAALRTGSAATPDAP